MRNYRIVLALVVVCTVLSVVGVRADSGGYTPATGDRIAVRTGDSAVTWNAAAVSAPIGEDYPLGPGDVLEILVKGRIDLNYHVGLTTGDAVQSGSANADQTTVNSAGEIILPIAGPVNAAGKTVAQLREDVASGLSDYFKHFDVNISVARPRMMKVFINGAVRNPGAQVVPGTVTLLEVFLAAGVEANGSTRRVELHRNGTVRTVDLYSVVMKGELDKNPLLQAGDMIYVPPVSQWIDVSGEANRTGRYELLPGMRLKDAIDLSLGLEPAAAPTDVTIERPDSNGEVVTLRADAAKALASADSPDNILLSNGDRIRVPSLSEYMPLVRMVGEFVGRGVYQRVIGNGEEQVLNKSGVYLLSKGKTAGEVIRETGGVTPQADLTHARVVRKIDGKSTDIPLDLEKLLMQNDESADLKLQSGDTIVLPSLPDKVYVFGAVTKPGSYPYTPGRKLIDYVGDAGGQTTSGRLSHVRVIRGDPKNPVIRTCDLTKGVKTAGEDNPTLQPGDAVFVAAKSFNGWRDVISVITTFGLIRSLTN